MTVPADVFAAWEQQHVRAEQRRVTAAEASRKAMEKARERVEAYLFVMRAEAPML